MIPPSAAAGLPNSSPTRGEKLARRGKAHDPAALRRLESSLSAKNKSNAQSSAIFAIFALSRRKKWKSALEGRAITILASEGFQLPVQLSSGIADPCTPRRKVRAPGIYAGA